jgi:hypothetical protein
MQRSAAPKLQNLGQNPKTKRWHLNTALGVFSETRDYTERTHLRLENFSVNIVGHLGAAEEGMEVKRG